MVPEVMSNLSRTIYSKKPKPFWFIHLSYSN